MITESEVEKAAEYIRTHAEEYAEAKAQRMYLDKYCKSLKAIKMQEVDGRIEDKKAYAYASEEYLANLDALADAVKKEETIRWKMEASKIKAEVYRSQQFTARNQDNVNR